jgi:hypothetical protein
MPAHACGVFAWALGLVLCCFCAVCPGLQVMSCNTPCTALIVCLHGDRLPVLGATLRSTTKVRECKQVNAERNRHCIVGLQRPECPQCGYSCVLQVHARTATYECSVPSLNQSRRLCCLCTASRHAGLRPGVLQHESYIGLPCVDSIMQRRVHCEPCILRRPQAWRGHDCNQLRPLSCRWTLHALGRAVRSGTPFMSCRMGTPRACESAHNSQARRSCQRRRG